MIFLAKVASLIKNQQKRKFLRSFILDSKPYMLDLSHTF